MSLLHVFGSILLLGTLLAGSLPAAPETAGKYLVYVGTYTGPNSKGIYAYRFDPATGALESIGLAGEVVNPSFLTLHPNRKFLYAVSELGVDGKTNGLVTAFAIDAKSGRLTKLNTVSTIGGGACHLVVDHTGKALYVANYGTGSTAAFPVHADGSLGEHTALIQHKGSSVGRRQRGPHAHGVYLSADNRFLLVPDLGLDQVLVFRIDPAKASLTPNDPPFGSVPPGLGPRHMAFHPGGKYVYVLNEMGSRVTAFDFDGSRGALKELQTISTLPKDFKGEDNSAEIEVDRAGRFVYASNRGHDSITVFSIGKDGRLTPVETVLTLGKTPRNFKIDPSGAYLLAANQDSNNIVLFHVDRKTGRLKPTGKRVDCPAPVSIQFVPAS
ncbi:MAG TPA: lactonase family protein [Bryobacteraceae bacterium]|nr:lactonase family protein [Bryobacteraceae bacterium]